MSQYPAIDAVEERLFLWRAIVLLHDELASRVELSEQFQSDWEMLVEEVNATAPENPAALLLRPPEPE